MAKLGTSHSGPTGRPGNSFRRVLSCGQATLSSARDLGAAHQRTSHITRGLSDTWARALTHSSKKIHELHAVAGLRREAMVPSSGRCVPERIVEEADLRPRSRIVHDEGFFGPCEHMEMIRMLKHVGTPSCDSTACYCTCAREG